MTVEQHAKKYKNLHPEVRKFLIPYFSSFNLAKVKVKVRVPFAALTWLSKLFLRGRYLYYVRGKTLVIDEGIFNIAPALDLTTPRAMAVLAHEIKHIEQWYDSWLLFSWQFVSGVVISIFKERRLYGHKSIKYEIEAIKFVNEIRSDIEQRSLKVFAEI